MAALLMVPPVIVSVPGMSSSTSERKVGTAAAPLPGPAHTRFAPCVLKVPVNVPVVVTGEPDIVNTLAGKSSPTEATTLPPVNATRIGLPLVEGAVAAEFPR